MAITTVHLVLAIESKDECEDGPGRLPAPEEVAPVVRDVLADETKGDFALPWRVVGAEEMA